MLLELLLFFLPSVIHCREINGLHNIVRLPPAVLHDVGIGDSEGVRYTYVVVAEVMKPEVRAAAVLYGINEPISNLVRLAVDERAFDSTEFRHKEVRNIDISVRICSLWGLCDPKAVFISHYSFADQQSVAYDVFISQRADLAAPEGAER